MLKKQPYGKGMNKKKKKTELGLMPSTVQCQFCGGQMNKYQDGNQCIGIGDATNA